jgi:hypothetical protein
MSNMVSRRTILHAAVTAGLGATAVIRADGAEPSQPPRTPVDGGSVGIDAYERMLRLHGGELGGRKPPR